MVLRILTTTLLPKPEQHTFTVKFDQNGLVSSAELDKPLPEVAKQDENNTIISTPENAGKKSWWKFGSHKQYLLVISSRFVVLQGIKCQKFY